MNFAAKLFKDSHSMNILFILIVVRNELRVYIHKIWT